MWLSSSDKDQERDSGLGGGRSGVENKAWKVADLCSVVDGSVSVYSEAQ